MNDIFLSKYRYTVFITLLPIFFCIAVFILVEADLPSICIFKAITGHECWGCGMTRAFYALFHMQFFKAYEINPRIVIVAPLLVYIWITTLSKSLIKLKTMTEKISNAPKKRERG